MTDLSKKKCIACEGDIPPFDKSEIHLYLTKVDGWAVKSDKDECFFLTKDFKFKNLLPFASVPALETENSAPLYFKLFTGQVVVSNSPAR